MGFSATAQAQTEVWSATLTVKELSTSVFGCTNSTSSVRCSDFLSEDEFTYDSTDYAITAIFLTRNAQLQIHFDTDLTTAAQTLTLEVDGTTFAFEDAHVSAAQQRAWSRSGLSWSAGDAVALRLTETPATANNPATGSPRITGTAQVGQSLYASLGSVADADGTRNIVASYQWIRVDGATETDITGATITPYTPVADDVGKQLKVRLSFTDDLGNPESRTSAATQAVLAAAGANNPATGNPFITGLTTPQVGQSLSASVGSINDADGTRNIVASYQWIRVDGATETDITGATITPYTPVAGDVGKQLKVRASFTDDLGNPESRTSPATLAVQAAATAQPTLTLDADPNRFSEAAGSVQICVVPSAVSTQRITVQVATADGTATAPDDYGAHSGTVALQPQQQRACFTVMLVDDADAEGDETFTVRLSNPVNATLGGARAVATFTIVDNDDTTVATDRAALVAFYTATGGPNWTDNTNWLSQEPLSEWHGVRTNGDGRVTELYLPSLQLSGEIPAELGDLTSLWRLYLNDNQLTGTIPAALGGLTNLQWLYLYNNQLSGEIPVELGDLTSLQQLWLSGNQLSGEIPAELGNLTSLQRLQLNVNQFDGEIPEELGQLTSLEILDLANNQLDGEIPAALGNLTNLRFLDLNDNQLSGEIPAALGGLTNLQQLILYSNQLDGEIPAKLGDLTSLQRLYLYDNQLTMPIPEELGNLGSLQFLYLYDNQLSGEIPAALGNLTSLQRLQLNVNQFDGEIPEELGGLTSLQFLLLDNNQLSGEIPVELGNLASLQELYLNDNQLSGPLPLSLSALSQLSVLDIKSTALCAPVDAAFQAWLAMIDFRGSACGTRTPPGGGGGGGGGGGPRTSAPSAVRNLMVAGGDGQAVLTWRAPSSDGGAAITDYEYRIDRRNPWISTGSTETTHTVTGLDNGTVYVFEVRAVNRIGKGRASSRAEATPEAFTLDFAHFANGAAITSDLVFVNVGTHPIRPVLYFYDTEGALVSAESVVDITGDLAVMEDGGLSIQTAMESLGELTISTHGQGELVSGSVRAVAGGAIGGVLRFDLPDIGVAGVGASQPVRDAVFPVRRREGGINTGVAVHNLGEEAMEVTCELMQGGTVLDDVSLPLAANGQSSWFIDAAFPAADTSGFAGSVHCDAAGPGMFTAVALELDAVNRIFTTLPVFPARRAGGRAAELNFAHFANGDGLTSDLVFLNLSTERSRPAPTPFHSDILPIRPALYFYDTEGQPMAAESVVDLTGDLAVAEDGGLTVLTEMEPLGVLTISTHGRGELVSGSVRVVADEPIGGLLRFDLPGIGVAGVGASSPVSDALFPVRRRESGINTGVAIHNLESSPEIVRCELMREGVLRDAVPIPLAGNGQVSWFIDEMFPATDTSDFTGSVRCTVPDGGSFAGVAVELDAANRIFTTLPVVPVPERTSQE